MFQTRRHADTQTRRHADTQTRRHADTQTRRHADTKLLSFFAILPLFFFFTSSVFAASSSHGASALGDMSISMPDSYDLAAECLDIILYEDVIPEVCADFVRDSLELAVNSSYSFEEERPEVRGHGNSQTIAAQISYDAKQAYLAEIENEAASRAAENAQGLIAYNPHQIGYVEYSTKHGLSASTKGIKVIADNQLNVPNAHSKYDTAVKVGFILAAVAVSVAALSGRSGKGKSCDELHSDKRLYIYNKDGSTTKTAYKICKDSE